MSTPPPLPSRPPPRVCKPPPPIPPKKAASGPPALALELVQHASSMPPPLSPSKKAAIEREAAEQIELTKAATRIQAVMRGKTTRANTPRKWKRGPPPLKPKKPPPKKIKRMGEIEAFEMCALKIQSRFRGRRGRIVANKRRAPPMKPKPPPKPSAPPPPPTPVEVAPEPEPEPAPEASWEDADTDGDGHLDQTEVKALLSAMGFHVSDAYFEDMFHQFDADSSGTIEVHEYQQLFSFLQRKVNTPAPPKRPAVKGRRHTWCPGSGADKGTPRPAMPKRPKRLASALSAEQERENRELEGAATRIQALMRGKTARKAASIVLQYDVGGGTPSDDITVPELRKLVAVGTVQGDTSVWTEGMADWKPFGVCKALFGFAADEKPERIYNTLQYATGGDEQCSPEITLAEIHALVEKGTIKNTTKVWTDGMDDWYKWGQVKTDFGFEADPEPEDGGPKIKFSTMQYETATGPSESVNMAEAKKLLGNGTIKNGTQVWSKGMDNWYMFGDVKTWFDLDDDAVTLTAAILYELPNGLCSDKITLPQLLVLVGKGEVTERTRCWADGMTDWDEFRACKTALGASGVVAQAGVAAEVTYAGFASLRYDTGNGPSDMVSMGVVRKLIEANTFGDDTQVWTDGMEGWQLWRECKTLFGNWTKYSVLKYETSVGAPSESIGLDKIAEAVAEGAIGEGTKVWTDGMDDWTPFGECKQWWGFSQSPTVAKEKTLVYATVDGPSAEIPLAEVWHLVRSGKIKDSTEVWSAGMDDWSAFGPLKAEWGCADLASSEKYTHLQYETDDGPSKPVTARDFYFLVAKRKVQADTRVWSEGMDDWTPYNECKDDFDM